MIIIMQHSSYCYSRDEDLDDNDEDDNIHTTSKKVDRKDVVEIVERRYSGDDNAKSSCWT